MPFRLTPQHAAALARPHLHAGEEVLLQCHGMELPWWSWFSRLGHFFSRYFVLVATNQRLMLIEVTRLWREKRFEAVPWSELTHFEVRRGLLTRPLLIAWPSRPSPLRLTMPRFTPLAQGTDVARELAALWQTHRALAQPVSVARQLP